MDGTNGAEEFKLDMDFLFACELKNIKFLTFLNSKRDSI